MKKILGIIGLTAFAAIPTNAVVSCQKYSSEFMYGSLGGEIHLVVGKIFYEPYFKILNPKEGEKIILKNNNGDIVDAQIDENDRLVIKGIGVGTTSIFLSYKGAKSLNFKIFIKENEDNLIFKNLSEDLTNTNLGKIDKNLDSQADMQNMIREKNPTLKDSEGFEIDFDKFGLRDPGTYVYVWPRITSKIYQGPPVKVTFEYI